jgi:hypothetical protein
MLAGVHEPWEIVSRTLFTWPLLAGVNGPGQYLAGLYEPGQC